MDLSGIHTAKVLKQDIDEELKRQRIFVRVISIHDTNDNFTDLEYGIWVEDGNRKPFQTGYMPEKDSFVYIMFLKNEDNEYDPNKAVYFGEVVYNI